VIFPGFSVELPLSLSLLPLLHPAKVKNSNTNAVTMPDRFLCESINFSLQNAGLVTSGPPLFYLV
jgi:hypothetical protein